MAKGDPSLSDLTNTFVLSSTSNNDPVLSEIPKGLTVDPSRQRRVHQKSVTGCENCRRRRVKVDRFLTTYDGLYKLTLWLCSAMKGRLVITARGEENAANVPRDAIG